MKVLCEQFGLIYALAYESNTYKENFYFPYFIGISNRKYIHRETLLWFVNFPNKDSK